MFLAQQPPPPQWASASSFTRFLDHTKRRTTVARTPLDEWSARRRDLYLKTHNTYNKHPCSPGGIRTHNHSRRAAIDLRLRPRGHWDRQIYAYGIMKLNLKNDSTSITLVVQLLSFPLRIVKTPVSNQRPQRAYPEYTFHGFPTPMSRNVI